MSYQITTKMCRSNALIIAGFNGVTAIFGGIALVGGFLNLPLGWLVGSWFPNYVVPGLILAAIVGGSSLVAAVAATTNRKSWPVWAVAAGLIMIGWIVGEVLIINQFNWLHIVYLLTGAGSFLVGFVAMRFKGEVT